MACVKQRRGKWVADWRDDDGRRYWKSFDTQEAANVHLGKMTERLQRGIFRRPSDVPTFAAVAHDWLALRATEVRVSTIVRFEGHLATHVLPTLGAIRVDQLRPRHFEVLCLDREAHGLEPQTVNSILGTASAVLRYAEAHDYVDRNVAKVVARRGRTDNEEVSLQDTSPADDDGGAIDPATVLTVEQCRRVIAHAAPGFYQTFFLTCMLTGGRVGELTGLTWNDIDLAAATIHIRRGVSWARRRGVKESGPRLYRPKTKAGFRSIPMRPELVAALRRWKLACPPTAEGWVFPSTTGQPRQRAAITSRGLHPACYAAGLPRTGPHAFRHTFASALLLAGRTPLEVAKLCGHSGPAVTMRVYAHFLGDRHADDALDALGGADVVANGSTGSGPGA